MTPAVAPTTWRPSAESRETRLAAHRRRLALDALPIARFDAGAPTEAGAR